MLSWLVIPFLPRSKCLLILWLQSSSAVILGTKKIKSVPGSNFSPSIYHEVMEPDAMILVFFECLVLSQFFFTLLFHFPQKALKFLFVFCHEGDIIVISEVIDISPGNLDSILCLIQSGISHEVLSI